MNLQEIKEVLLEVVTPERRNIPWDISLISRVNKATYCIVNNPLGHVYGFRG